MKSWSEKFWEARPLRGNGFPLSRQAFHARKWISAIPAGFSRPQASSSSWRRRASCRCGSGEGETLTITKIYR